MADCFSKIKKKFASEASGTQQSNLRPIAADPWVISSLLQKSIRRGETAIAERAALTLLSLRGSALWRRFMVIAFEDIGAGSIDALAVTVAGSDPTLRTSAGGNARAAAYLARLLCESAKDRSADYLGCGPKFHERLFQAPVTAVGRSLKCQLRAVANRNAPLFLRALAAWHACGIGRGRQRNGGLSALLQTYRELGAPQMLVEATGVAAIRTREPMTVMVPLVWLAANVVTKPTIRHCSVPPLIQAAGVPLYALDEHTRLGREAIVRFAQEHRAVRACLERYVAGSWRRAACLAAFYTDGFPVARRLDWPGSQEAEVFGIRNDLLLARVCFEGIEPLLQVFRENLPQLNAVRRAVFLRARGPRPQSAGR